MEREHSMDARPHRIDHITCYDCGTLFDSGERECPNCHLRACISVDYADELRGPDEGVSWRHYACDAGLIIGGLVCLAGLVYCLAGKWGWGLALVSGGYCLALVANHIRRTL
jgi:hypothetical protein